MGILSEKLTIPEPFSFGDMPKNQKYFVSLPIILK